jgi:hypothetical protein
LERVGLSHSQTFFNDTTVDVEMETSRKAAMQRELQLTPRIYIGRPV